MMSFILVKLLPQRLKRAKAILNESSDKLNKLIEASPGAFKDTCIHIMLADLVVLIVHFDVEAVRVWISNERNSLSNEGTSVRKAVSRHLHFFVLYM